MRPAWKLNEYSRFPVRNWRHAVVLACIFFLKLSSVLDEIGFEIIFSVIVEVARFDECICLDTYCNAVRHNIVRRV